jgi:hypothetical protein
MTNPDPDLMREFGRLAGSQPTGRIERKVALVATDKHMTAWELRQFVRALDEAHVPDETEVKGRTTMSGHINKIEV